MGTLVVLHGTGGRLGNRLLLQAHLMAFCLERPRWRLINFNFVPYAELFEASRHHPWMIFPPRRAAGGLLRAATPAGIAAARAHQRLPARWASRISRHGTRLTYRLLGTRAHLLEWGDGRRQDLGEPEFVARTENLGWFVLGGFWFRDWAALERHQETIRAFLRPAAEHVAPAEALLHTLRQRYRTVIGVLVRRTDYAHWLNGKFFFAPAQYREWMEQLVRLYGPGTGLLIAGDDPETAALLDGLPAQLTTGAAGRPGHYMESVAALARCDLIASPPSTFAAMAAFLGDVPIMPLQHAGQTLRVEDVMTRHLFDAVEHPAFRQAVT